MSQSRTLQSAHIRPFAVLLLTACITVLLVGTPGIAQAKKLTVDNVTLENAKGTIVSSYIEGEVETNWVWLGYSNPNTKKPTSVKLSNKKVANLETWDGIIVAFKKPGTTTLTYKLNGKKHKLVLKKVKYQNPVRSFKIGSKEYRSIFTNSCLALGPKIPKKGKLVVKAAKGWKVKSIYLSSPTVESKKVSNGAKLLKKTWAIEVVLYNKKAKMTEKLHWAPL